MALGFSRAMRKQADKQVTTESGSDTERREEVKKEHTHRFSGPWCFRHCEGSLRSLNPSQRVKAQLYAEDKSSSASRAVSRWREGREEEGRKENAQGEKGILEENQRVKEPNV